MLKEEPQWQHMTDWLVGETLLQIFPLPSVPHAPHQSQTSCRTKISEMNIITYSPSRPQRCVTLSQPEEMIQSHTPVFLNEDTLASVLWIHIVDVKVPIRGSNQESGELLNPEKHKMRITHYIHAP